MYRLRLKNTYFILVDSNCRNVNLILKKGLTNLYLKFYKVNQQPQLTLKTLSKFNNGLADEINY